MPDSFPPVNTGGSLLIAWQLKHKHVLIVGGGNVAADRIRSVLAAWDAASQSPKISLVCPLEGLNDEVRFRIFDQSDKWHIHHVARNFQESDLEHKDLVLTATDDEQLSHRIHGLCKEKRIVVNVADVPPLCDFYFGSLIQRGPLQIMVSTNGKSPRLANRIRRQIQDSLPKHVDKAISGLGKLRAELRQRNNAQSDSPARMQWMIDVTDAWTLDEICDLDDRPEWRKAILDQGWLHGQGMENKVITHADLSGKRPGAKLWLKAVAATASVNLGSVAVGALVGAAATFSWMRFARS